MQDSSSIGSSALPPQEPRILSRVCSVHISGGIAFSFLSVKHALEQTMLLIVNTHMQKDSVTCVGCKSVLAVQDNLRRKRKFQDTVLKAWKVKSGFHGNRRPRAHSPSVGKPCNLTHFCLPDGDGSQ